ncbi:MAG: GlsB/YeaQ/YmgE family stress response membrane protein [Bdellovibrionota bacterium]
MDKIHSIFNSQSAFIQHILVWIGLGLVIGVLAKLIMPGNENMGWIRTILLGIAGSFLGIMGAAYFFRLPNYSAFSWQGIVLGVIGAFVLVLFNRLVTKS